MLKDYNMSFVYHRCKANVVEDSLSRMSICSVSHIDEVKKGLEKDFHRLARMLRL